MCIAIEEWKLIWIHLRLESEKRKRNWLPFESCIEWRKFFVTTKSDQIYFVVKSSWFWFESIIY
jgi:hypothetical protein